MTLSDLLKYSMIRSTARGLSPTAELLVYNRPARNDLREITIFTSLKYVDIVLSFCCRQYGSIFIHV